MNCPDIDRLIDFSVGGGSGPEVETHLERCAACRGDLRTIQRIRASFGPETEVPERLIQRIIAGLPESQPALESQRFLWSQALITGFLGSLTAMAAVFVAGSADAGSQFGVLLFSLGVGVVFLILQVMVGKKAPTANT